MSQQDTTENRKNGNSPIRERLITIRVRSGEYDFETGLATYVVAHGGETIVIPIDAVEDIRSAEIGGEFAK